MYYQLKKKALELIITKLEHYNKIYNYSFNKITIKNQKTRWGSCSIKKNLNFNYRIALLPSELSNYIVVHDNSRNT